MSKVETSNVKQMTGSAFDETISHWIRKKVNVTLVEII